MDLPGRQDVVVVRTVPAVDDDGNPIYSEIMGVQTVEHIDTVTGCLFEIQDETEIQAATTTVSTRAWCVMPVTAVTRTIDSTMVLRYGGRDWQMRGDARIEVDLDGFEDHVLCICEAQKG